MRTASVSSPNGSISKPSRAASSARSAEHRERARLELHRERREQRLALDAVREPGRAQLLVEHALVRGVLIDEQQVLLALDQQIGREQLAEQAQLAEAHARVCSRAIAGARPARSAREQPV